MPEEFPELLEQWVSYIELCVMTNTMPSMYGFGKHLMESYKEEDGSGE